MRDRLDAIFEARANQFKEDIKAEVFSELRRMSVKDLMDVLHGGDPAPAAARARTHGAPGVAKRGPGRPKKDDAYVTGPIMNERILAALDQADRPLALGEICRLVQGGKNYVGEKLSKLRRAGKTEMRGDKGTAKHASLGKFNDEAWKSVMGKDYVPGASVPAVAAPAPAEPEPPAPPAPVATPAPPPSATASKATPPGVHRRPKRAAAG